MRQKLIVLGFFFFVFGVKVFSQNMEIIHLKKLSTSTGGGGDASIYYFLKDFNQQSGKDWDKIKAEILKIFEANQQVSQLTIWFLNKPVYDFSGYKQNAFGHPVPDNSDMYAFTVGNKSSNNTRCSTTVTGMTVIEPTVGFLSNICYPQK